MSIILPQFTAAGAVADSALFGGNILAPRAAMTGERSYEKALDDLGVTGLRYPGGALTEYYFDIANPNATTVTHAETGETSTFISISEFMDHAAENEHAVTIVIPTRDQLGSKHDGEGNRLPDIDEDTLREFIHDVASGVYGEAEIAGFELGNEYWHSGQMNAVEYGKLSAEMAVIVKDELKLVDEVHGIDTGDMSVLVQMGQNYGHSNLSESYEGWTAEDVIDDLLEAYPGADLSYDDIRGNGEPNWTLINNELVRMAFDTPEKVDSIDGIIAHVYSRGPENEGSRTYDLDNIRQGWLEKEGFENLEIHVTEWNLKSTSGLDREEDYGLYQAHEMLDLVEEFMTAGVDQAHVWPLIQNTSNPLSVGMDYSGPTAPGKMFSMMSKNLPGKAVIDFTPGDDQSTEFKAGPVDVHAFAGKGDMVLYIASSSDEPTLSDVDLSGLVAGFDSMEVSVLGVAPGETPGNTRSEAEVRSLEAGKIYQDGILEADLDAGEIMQVVIRNLVPTDDFASTIEAIDADLEDETAPEDGLTPDTGGSADGDFDDILIPPLAGKDEADEKVPAEDDDDVGDSDGGGFGAAALALLPILALLALGM